MPEIRLWDDRDQVAKGGRILARLGYSAIKAAYELLTLGRGINYMTEKELELVDSMARAILKQIHGDGENGA